MELMQISAGRGPIECSWAVWHVFLMLRKAAIEQALSVELVDQEPDRERDTFKSLIVSVTGDAETRFAAEWTGTIQWTAQSPFRPTHRRKNWFVSINVLPQYSEESISLKDVRIETMRSSGAGGQHVNKTESGVRAIHLPTATAVVITSQRSQHQNKKLALAVLMSKIAESESRKRELLERQHWQNHNELIRGNPVKKFIG